MTLNDILLKYGDIITKFQKEILCKLFQKFNNIQKRTAFYCAFYDEDSELILYRNSSNGITNIIIHDSESLVFSYIGKISGEELLFYNNQSDFDIIAQKFFEK